MFNQPIWSLRIALLDQRHARLASAALAAHAIHASGSFKPARANTNAFSTVMRRVSGDNSRILHHYLDAVRCAAHHQAQGGLAMSVLARLGEGTPADFQRCAGEVFLRLCG